MINYFSLYSDLYDKGYHEDPSYTHARQLCYVLRSLYEFETVLDIGCSRGWVLNYFKDKDATGIDVSRPAIKYCERKGYKVKQLSATQLGYFSEFDLIIATDVLEHLTTEDAIRACKLIRKTAKKLIAVKIPNALDVAHWKEIAGMNLHLTVQPLEWWKEKLSRPGDKVTSPFKDCLIIEKKGKK